MIENSVWKLLIVEDDEDDYFIVYKMLADARKGKFVLDWVRSYQAGVQALQATAYDAVLLDYDLGGETGDQLIHDAVALGYQSPILVLTGRGNYDIDLKTMEAGAADYLSKGELNAMYLERSIRYAIERKRTENTLAQMNTALQAAERRVRDILSGITDCYFLLDHHWTLIDINWKALQYLEKTAEDLVWKVVWDSNPILEDPVTGETFRHVAETGQSAHFEMHLSSLNRWAEVHAYPVEEGIAVYFADITKRKRDEQNTQFLADLGEKLIQIDDPDAMIQSSMQAIVDYLAVDHCILEAVFPAQATTRILAEYHTQPQDWGRALEGSDFLRSFYELRRLGQALLVFNTAENPATAPFCETVFEPLAIGAYLGIPRLVDGQWANTLVVASRAPRQWREDETTLLRQAGDLIWLAVENARLLQNLKAAQARLDIALKNSEITVYTTDQDLRYTWLYRPMPPYLSERVIGLRDEDLPERSYLSELILLKQQVIQTRKGVHQEVQVCIDEEPTYLDLTIEPYEGPNGEATGTIVSCINTTRFHQMEDQIQSSIAHVALQRRIMESREEERKQISRDLHDGPLQSTIGLVFSIEAALDMHEQDQLQEILTNTRVEAQKLVAELRSVCNQLRPPILAQFGLSKAIRSYAGEFQDKYPDIALSLDLCDDGQTLPESTRLALYRIYQEGLSNIIRHSRATKINVSYALADNHAILTIKDNGVGCKNPINWQELAEQGHLGLLGMKERAETLNGQLMVMANPDSGTQIRAVIPYFAQIH